MKDNKIYYLNNECIEYINKSGKVITSHQETGTLKCVRWRKDKSDFNSNKRRIKNRRK